MQRNKKKAASFSLLARERCGGDAAGCALRDAFLAQSLILPPLGQAFLGQPAAYVTCCFLPHILFLSLVLLEILPRAMLPTAARRRWPLPPEHAATFRDPLLLLLLPLLLQCLHCWARVDAPFLTFLFCLALTSLRPVRCWSRPGDACAAMLLHQRGSELWAFFFWAAPPRSYIRLPTIHSFASCCSSSVVSLACAHFPLFFCPDPAGEEHETREIARAGWIDEPRSSERGMSASSLSRENGLRISGLLLCGQARPSPVPLDGFHCGRQASARIAKLA